MIVMCRPGIRMPVPHFGMNDVFQPFIYLYKNNKREGLP